MNNNDNLGLFTNRESIQAHPSNDETTPSFQFQSPYITQGVYTHSIRYDPSISMKTLEIVKALGNKVIIGRGALSTVYLAKDPLKNSYYAIKEMKKEVLMETLRTLEPIYNEIDIHSRLIHKNIIKVYNVHEDNDTIKIILEHGSQGSLYTYIKRSKGLTEKKAFDFFIQAASAIHFLHSNDIIHRDLKPENFIITENDDLKLCDFGWSNRINNSRDTICGTVEYMAPEIIKRQQYDKAIDIWSLGILLYELIHKHSPFNSNDNSHGNPSEIMSKIKDDNVLFEKAISKECQDIIKRMLEKDQKKRITIYEIFKHPFVKYYEKSHQKHASMCEDAAFIRRQMTTNNEQLPNFNFKANKMKQIANMILLDTIDLEESFNNKGGSNTKTKVKKDYRSCKPDNIEYVKPRNKLSFKMEMKTSIKTSKIDSQKDINLNSKEDSNDSKETAITPVKTMSVKLTNNWFSKLKKHIVTASLLEEGKMNSKQVN